MSLRYHHVSRDMFAALAGGGGGPDAVHELVTAQYSKHLLLLRVILRAAKETGHSQVSFARSGYALLAAAQRHDPAAAGAVIRHPSVGAWAMRTLRALRGGPPMAGAEPAGLCAVAAAAAVRAGLDTDIEVPVIARVVVLPSLGAATAADGMARVRNGHGGVTITTDDSP